MKDSGKHFGTFKLKWALVVYLIIVGMFPKAFTQEYFQQKVNYTIDVKLNDKSHELSAFEKVEYINLLPTRFSFCIFTFGQMPIRAMKPIWQNN